MTAESIRTDGIATVITGLFELPDQIESAATAYAKARAEYDYLSAARAGLRANMLIAAVAAALFDDGKGGKRAAKNDDEREAALTILAERDVESAELERTISRARAEVDRSSAELERYRALQTNYRELSKLLQAEPF